MYRFVPPRSKENEVENKQFKQTNEPLERLYFYVPHDGTVMTPIVGDMVFHFVSHKDRHFNNRTLILRSLAGLNTLLREPKAAHVATPDLIFRSFKYLGVCHTERPHFRRTETHIRRINITYAGCMRMLDVFADVDTLLEVHDELTGGPRPLEDCSFVHLYLWLRPCGFDDRGRIVMRDASAKKDDKSAEEQTASADEYDFSAPDLYHYAQEDADDADRDLYAYDDPFESAHMHVDDGLNKAEREKKKREEEEIQKKLEAKRLTEEQPPCFWQWVPVASPFPMPCLYDVVWPNIDPKTGGPVSDGSAGTHYPFRTYPYLLYVGRAMTGVRGDAKYMSGNAWRHLVFGPPVQTAKMGQAARDAANAFETAMRNARPLCRVINVDATMAH